MQTLKDIRRLIEAKKFETGLYTEAVNSDDTFDLKELAAKAETNKLIRRYMKELTTNDAISVLAAMQSQILQPVDHMAVAREIVNVVPTTTPVTRVYERTKGSVWRIADGVPPQTSGRYTYQEITLDHEYGQDALFTKDYLEDAPFPIIEAEVNEVGQLLEEQLTTDVIAMYDAVAAASLAGGAVINSTTSGTLAWKDITAGLRTLKQAGTAKLPGRKVLLVSSWEYEDLLNDDKFINTLYVPTQVNGTDYRTGTLRSTLGFDIIESDLMANDAGGSNGNFAYMMNVDQAAMVTMRRDRLVEPYNEKLVEGMIATNRYGLKVLRPIAMARIDIVH